MEWEARPDYWDQHPMSREVPPYWCDGKVKWASMAEAIDKLHLDWGKGNGSVVDSNTAYHCETCGCYHIGDMSIKPASRRRQWIRLRKGNGSHKSNARDRRR